MTCSTEHDTFDDTHDDTLTGCCQFCAQTLRGDPGLLGSLALLSLTGGTLRTIHAAAVTATTAPASGDWATGSQHCLIAATGFAHCSAPLLSMRIHV